jgi:hypothetical protein
MYISFIVSYMIEVSDNLPNLFPNTFEDHRFWSLVVLPLPWLLVAYFQFADPGSITSENVEHFLNVYPYDDVLYKRHFCRTLSIPAVARSRFCRYTERRVAYFYTSNPQTIRPLLPMGFGADWSTDAARIPAFSDHESCPFVLLRS